MYDFVVGYVHEGEFDRNVALGNKHPFAIGLHSAEYEVAQERQRCARI
jgi:nitrate/TMAO reductase-like tetraheme cytochrome c subunit